MMVIAAIGVIGAGVMGQNLNMEIPAFTGFQDPLSSLGTLFPALFVTIACGAISGFHSLVGSGTTAKQLDNERDARPIAYGGMLDVYKRQPYTPARADGPPSVRPGRGAQWDTGCTSRGRGSGCRQIPRC